MVSGAHAAASTHSSGILGGGSMARVHSRAARSAGASLAVLPPSRLGGSERAAAELGFATAAAPDDFFAHPVDVVHVCSPNRAHAQQSLSALESGSHIICEKPLATDSATAGRVLERAEELGLGGTVPFVYRYHPMVREARARIRRGDTGALLTVDASYLQDWLADPDDENWRVDTGSGGPSRAFADIGCHLVDLIEFIAGQPITALPATTRTVHPPRRRVPVRTAG